LMRDDEDAPSLVMQGDRVEGAAEPEDDVAPALAAGRPVIEFAEIGAQGGLFGMQLHDPGPGQAVEDAEFLLAQALVDDEPGRVRGGAGRRAAAARGAGVPGCRRGMPGLRRHGPASAPAPWPRRVPLAITRPDATPPESGATGRTSWPRSPHCPDSRRAPSPR